MYVQSTRLVSEEIAFFYNGRAALELETMLPSVSLQPASIVHQYNYSVDSEVSRIFPCAHACQRGVGGKIRLAYSIQSIRIIDIHTQYTLLCALTEKPHPRVISCTFYGACVVPQKSK